MMICLFLLQFIDMISKFEVVSHTYESGKRPWEIHLLIFSIFLLILCKVKMDFWSSLVDMRDEKNNSFIVTEQMLIILIISFLFLDGVVSAQSIAKTNNKAKLKAMTLCLFMSATLSCKFLQKAACSLKE